MVLCMKIRLSLLNRLLEELCLVISVVQSESINTRKLLQGENIFACTQIREQLAEQTGESRTQINRYIRLTELVPELLDLVDQGKIGLRPAVELSYLNVIEQNDLVAAIGEADATPSHAQAIKMRRFSKEEKLTPEVIESIMSEEKPNQKPKISFKYETIKRLIPSSIPYNKTEEYVVKALEYYHRHLQRQRENVR